MMFIKYRNRLFWMIFSAAFLIVILKTRKFRQYEWTDGRKRVILFWVPFFKVPDYSFGLGSRPFQDHRCPVRNCETTTNRSRLLEADVVVFHIRDIGKNQGTPSVIPSLDMPPVKPANQRWLFYLHESPVHTSPDTKLFKHWFNWTMTYRKDGDFFMPYGHTAKKARPLEESPKISNFFKANGPRVAWMASNCKTPGRREDYVNKLRSFIPIDVYGSCGSLKCSASKKIDCLKSVESYLFYLSFENSICRDYISEKLWPIMNETRLVPIVYGGGDYEADLPPNSFIDARKFSPKELAEHLKRVFKDERLYARYHSWRRQYEVRSGSPTGLHQFCRLCATLNEKSLTPKWYEDIWDYWTNKKCD